MSLRSLLRLRQAGWQLCGRMELEDLVVSDQRLAHLFLEQAAT
jgi:hypothetical protein